jgi:hypothetical protein
MLFDGDLVQFEPSFDQGLVAGQGQAASDDADSHSQPRTTRARQRRRHHGFMGACPVAIGARMNRRPTFLVRLAAISALGLSAAVPSGAATARPVAHTEYDMAQWAPFEQARGGGLTRAEVRESLQMARLLGLTSRGGETGDSDALLMARETFNALQTEVRATQALHQESHGSLVVE